MKWSAFSAIAACILLACASGSDSQDPDAGGSGPDTGSVEVSCADSPCFDAVPCTDLDDGVQCGDCPAGFLGDGFSCTDINGCIPFPCAAGTECTDVPAPGDGFTCGACPPGTEGDGLACTDIDGCTGMPCADDVQCLDIAAPGTGFSCGSCPAGTVGDGMACVDIDGCAGDPCYPGVSCADVPAPGTGFVCGSCPSGYDGDGFNCSAICTPLTSLGCGSSVASNTNALGSQDRIDDWACTPSLTHSGREVIYGFTAPATGRVGAFLSGLTDDLDLIVVTDSGGICNPDVASSCVGSSVNATTTNEAVVWNAIAGTKYNIIIDGFAGASANFTLQIGTSINDVELNEIGSGTIDFVEVVNRGVCAVGLSNFNLRHKPSCQGAFDFTFPSVNLGPGGIYRAVEDGPILLGNEASFGSPLCDNSSEMGYTALCYGGACNTASCNNVYDYVERDGDLSDGISPREISCVSFSPGPIDVSLVVDEASESLRRIFFDGLPATWLRSDWTIGTATYE